MNLSLKTTPLRRATPIRSLRIQPMMVLTRSPRLISSYPPQARSPVGTRRPPWKTSVGSNRPAASASDSSSSSSSSSSSGGGGGGTSSDDKDGFDYLLPHLYGALAVSFVGLTAAIVVPVRVLDSVLLHGIKCAAWSLEELALAKVAAAAAFVPALACWSLRDSAIHGRLTSETYQRLNIGLAFCAIYALFSEAVLRMWTLHVPASTAMTVASIPLVAASLGLWKGGFSGERLAMFEEIMVGDDWNVLKMDPFRSVRAAIYTVGYAAFALLSVLMLLGSEEVMGWLLPFDHKGSAVGLHLVRLIGAGSFVAAKACAVLKDGLNRGRLTAGTFRRMSLGLGLAGTGQLVSLVQGLGWSTTGPEVAPFRLGMFAVVLATLWLATGATGWYGWFKDRKKD